MSAPHDTLASRLLTVARSHQDRPAIVDSNSASLTYAELQQRSMRIACWLLQTREAERHIGVYLPPSVPAALANYGITLSGKAAVNLNFTAGPANVRAAIELCELRTIFTSRAFLNRVGAPPSPEMVFWEDLASLPESDAALPDVTPQSTACILFSSGSTGIPKGIELTHGNILANADGLAARIPPAADDCMLGVLPFFHSFGYTFSLWFPVLQGIRAVYHANPTDAKIIGQLAETHRATYFLSTPTFCHQYAAKLDVDKFSTLRYVIVGAEKLRERTAEEFRNHFGIELLAGYGCTELGPGVAVNTPIENKPGSVGKPLEGIEVRIADPETLAPLPLGDEGMILVNGPSRMPGYYKAPDQTTQAMRDHFYITGDIGHLDEDGYLYVTDRLARFSKIGGEMVPHLRIEEAAAALTPAFVTGIPDERRGERLILIYTDPQLASEDLQRHLTQSKLPPLWIPKREDMHRVESIPVLANGKTALKEARALAIATGS